MFFLPYLHKNIYMYYEIYSFHWTYILYTVITFGVVFLKADLTIYLLQKKIKI